MPYTQSHEFAGEDFTQEPLPSGEYESCTFVNCVFRDTSLREVVFIDCQFRGCDLSMADVCGTAFRDVLFTDCKLLGLHFEHANQFLLSVAFAGCQLNLSSFFKLNLKNASFTGCSLQEVDFAETNLTSATLTNCDLSGATFDRTVLEKADLRASYNYSIDPERNRIKKAKFSLPAVLGLLHKYNISVQ